MMNKILPRNENRLDRALRVILGLGILSLTVIGPRTPWGLVGLVFLLTGLVGSCPVYSLLGVGTCPKEGAC